MTLVSYAQNFEDVLLWRALGDVEQGFYIDVGAAHPDIDSVTRAFYDRGWRGTNAEPGPAAFARLAAARPRDVNLQVAVGAVAGHATFHVLEGAEFGLSTLDPDLAAGYRADGLQVRAIEREVDTLADICRRHAPAAIHFLKIDVEGGESAVLQGADFTAHRPWIVLVEATAPTTTKEVYGGWEPLLLASGYAFVWFDGLNRFYVADEHRGALASRFGTPPNVFDNFIRAADTDLAKRVQGAEATRDALLDRAADAERRAGSAEHRAEMAHLRLARSMAAEARAATRAAGLEQALADAALQMRTLAERIGAADARAARAREWLAAMRQSTSWRLTAPLRRLTSRPGIAEETAPEPPLLPDMPEPPPRPAPDPPATPVRAVHQFHSGSASGDAVTNAMLLTRDVLRGLGFDSRIFVEHRDPECSEAIRHIDELPQHDRYALIVRHSMGHDALERILALPVRKILIYHNITPPELLAGVPMLEEYARRGRAQLADLRPAVVAALADSEYNALELRRAGFAPVAACPILFDVDAMLAQAPAPARGPAFTVLFVGRVTRSKGQLELVEAFARFRGLYAGEARLVLVGRHGGAADRYLIEVLAAIRRLGLAGGRVELTGAIPEADKLRRYAEADLYVSLSQHEGFGVPLAEAAVYGVPVLAYPAGGAAYTIDGDAQLDDTSPDGVAARMAELARDPARRAAMVERQRRSLDRFRLDRHVPTLLKALDRAGASPPIDTAARAALASHMRFTVAGHLSGTYSLAEINRTVAAALEAERPGAVRLIAVEGDVTDQAPDVPPAMRDAVRTLLGRGPHPTAPEVVISQHYPVWVPPNPGDVTLALFFWEESLIPPETAATLTAAFDGVLAPSAATAKALIDSGVGKPVLTVPLAPNLDRFRRIRQDRPPRDPAAPFTFLHVSSCFPRKGVDALLAAYAAVFRRGDKVRLVIKGFPNPHNDVAAQLARVQEDEEAPAIELIGRDLDEDALLALYAAADAMVLPTRGEGYNLPAAEALAAGLQLIVTGAGGHMDWIGRAPPGSVRLLAYSMTPAATHLASPFSLWAEPDPADLRAALREAASRGPWLPAEFPPFGGGLAAAVSDFAADRLLAPAPEPPRVAWVTTWDVRCGIAEYARHLLAHQALDSLILADGRTAPDKGVIPAWQLGEMESLPGLTGEIFRQDPQAVVLQHQPGLMGWDMVTRLLGASALHGRVVCVALHSTRRLLDVPSAERDAAVHALRRVSRVVVHTLEDVNFLAGMGLVANVSLVPHGAPEPPGASPPIRTLSEPDPVLIGCYGFFLPGKGIPELIEALSIVRRRWPAARLCLVNAEYPAPDSAAEIARARSAASCAGLEDAVEFVTGFLDHADSRARLTACDLIVLPYRDSKEGSSAALRSALACGVPVAVTPLPLFAEAAGAAITLCGQSPADIAAGIAAALADPALRRATQDAARNWIAARSWPTVARRWDAMLRGLHASGVVMSPDDGTA